MTAGRASRGVLGCRDPILSDGQGLEAALATNERDGGQPAEDGRSRLGGARLHDPLPRIEAVRRPALTGAPMAL